MGKVNSIEFKVTGKEILEPGWRKVYNNDIDDDKDKEDEYT